MSHVAKIELEVTDLCALKAACRDQGLVFVEDQKSYAWYGRWVGDHPLPEGFSEEDLGQCDHAILVPGARYEIGVVRRPGKYHLLWDFWHEGGLEQALGPNACRLKQAYARSRVLTEARRRGYKVHEKRTTQGLRLTLSKRRS